MISQLLEKVVQLEITISELNSKLLAQDSYILTLEDQILNLKHKLVQNSKESSSMCTQTTYDKHILETFTQTAQESSKTSKYVQTDLILNKNFLMNDGISSAQKLLMAFEEANKVESIQEAIESEIKSEDSEKLSSTSQEKYESLNFISALNLKSDLPVKEPCLKADLNIPPQVYRVLRKDQGSII